MQEQVKILAQLELVEIAQVQRFLMDLLRAGR